MPVNNPGGTATLNPLLMAHYGPQPDTGGLSPADRQKLDNLPLPSDLAALLALKADLINVPTTESLQDLVAAMFRGGTHTGASITYDDSAGTLSITASGGGGATLTEEQVEDYVGGLVAQDTGILVTYDDAGNLLRIALAGVSFTAGDKAKLDALPTAEALAASLAAKADASATTTALAAKADTTAVNTALATKADADAVAASLATKANASSLAGKANVNHTHFTSEIRDENGTSLADLLNAAAGVTSIPEGSVGLPVTGVLMVTQAQYDALNAAGTSNEDVLYLILDAAGVAVGAMLRGVPVRYPGNVAASPVAFQEIGDFVIDKGLTYNFGANDIVLPSWAQGPMTVGTPSLVEYRPDGSILLKAERRGPWATEPARTWYSGALQVGRAARHAIGRVGADVHVTDPAAVAAWFTYAGNSVGGVVNPKEIDFELTLANGVIGWAPAVHMPLANGTAGRRSSTGRTMARAPYADRVQRLEYDLRADRCDFYCDGVLFETIRPADMAAGSAWDTTTLMNHHFCVEEHASWAGWNYASGHAAMRVYGLTPTALAPPAPPVSTVSDYDPNFLARIQEIAETYGGRPNVTPFTYYEGGANEIADANTHPMLGPFQHTAVKNGAWSDPTVWSSGVVPGSLAAHAGHNVSLGTFNILYDVSSDVILKDVFGPIGSRFRLDTTRSTRMRYCTRMLMGIAELIDPDPTHLHEAIWHPVEAPGASAKLGDMFMGPLRIRGAKARGHLRLKSTVAQTLNSAAAGNRSVTGIPAGVTSIEVVGAATSGWRVGHRILILGTEYVLPATSDEQYRNATDTGPGVNTYYGRHQNVMAQRTANEFQFGQDEQRTITSIVGDVISWSDVVGVNSGPLAFPHMGTTGTLDDGAVITRAPVVAHLSSNIRWRTATQAEDGTLDPNANHRVLQKRGHMMAMRHSDVDCRYFEVRNGGRTSTDPTLFVNDAGTPRIPDNSGNPANILSAAGGTQLANPINVRGRYPFHLHWSGGPYLDSPLIPVIGARIYADVGDVPCPGWLLTQHATRAALEDCVISNGRGGGMVSEVGNENGQWCFNVVTGIRGDGDRIDWGSRAETYSNHNDSAGVAYGNQSRVILMHGNIAGSCKAAFNWQAQKSEPWLRGLRDVDMRFPDGLAKGGSALGAFWQDEVYGNMQAQIPPMLDNEAWACRYCFIVTHRMNNSTVLGPDKIPMLIDGLVAINCPLAWEVSSYSNTYYMRNFLFQGPLNSMATSRGAHLGEQSWDWNFSNGYIRNYRYAIEDGGAHIQYEGNFVDIRRENVTDDFLQPYQNLPGGVDRATHPQRGVMGPPQDHPTNANQIIPRVWTFLTQAQLPTPYPLEPYGRKFPAGKPTVAFGQTPYWEIGDGTNGVASPGLSLTLTAGGGRNQGNVYFTIRDCAGDRKSFDYQYTDPYPSQMSVKGGRSLGKLTPEQLVQRWGCWQDGATWKCRVPFFGADRISQVTFHYWTDYTLNAFEPAFLALHNLGGVPALPEWPFDLERVPATQRPLTALPNQLKFLSRTRVEVVEGQALLHRLLVNEVSVRRQIIGGADAAQFAISGQNLTWAANGTRSRATAQDANADHTYEVTIRATDAWGNTFDQPHQFVVIPSARASATIVDDFTRGADEDLEANPSYLRLTGAAGGLAIRSGNLAVIGTTSSLYDMGSLGTSDMEVSVIFRNSGNGGVLFRMEDENNYYEFRRMDSGSRTQLDMVKAGVRTRVADFTIPISGLAFSMNVRGRKLVAVQEGNATNERLIRYPVNQAVTAAPTSSAGYQLRLLDLDTLAEPGSLLLPADGPMGTKVGIRSGTGAIASWLDNFNAKALNNPFP